MITISLFIFYVGAVFFEFLLDMAYGWELIFTFLLAVPIWWYAKRQSHVWAMLWGLGIVQVVLRFIISTTVAHKVDIIEPPINIGTPVIHEFAGVTMCTTWLVWCFLIACVMVSTTKSVVKKYTDYNKINEDKLIIHSINLFTVTVVASIINTTIAIKAYHLTTLTTNILAFIGITIVMAICMYIATVNIIRQRREELVEAEMKEEDKKCKKEEKEKSDS